MRRLNPDRMRPLKLRAWGSYPQDEQYFNSIFIESSLDFGYYTGTHAFRPVLNLCHIRFASF